MGEGGADPALYVLEDSVPFEQVGFQPKATAPAPTLVDDQFDVEIFGSALGLILSLDLLLELEEDGLISLASLELQVRFEIPEYDLSEFHRSIVVGRECDSSAFQCWAKEFPRRDPAERDQLLRWVARIVKRPLRAVTDMMSPQPCRRPKAKSRSARHP